MRRSTSRSSRSAWAAAGTPPTSSTRRSPSSPRSASTTPITSGTEIADIAGEKAGIITKQADDLGADRHGRGHRQASARGDGGAAGRRRCAPTPRWPARIPSSRCWAVRSPSAASCSNCRASAGCTPRSSCRCTANTRPTTPRSRWPRSRRSSAPARDRQLDIDAVRAGFAAATSPGRLERMRSAPTVFIDAAHNPAGAAALAQTLAEEFDFRYPGRRRLGDGRQGRRRHPGRAGAGVRPGRGDPQRLAAGAGRRRPGHARRRSGSGRNG